MSGLCFGSAATGLISAGFLAWAAIGGIIPVIGWVALGLSIVIGITIMWWKKHLWNIDLSTVSGVSTLGGIVLIVNLNN